MVLVNTGEPGVDDPATAMSCVGGPVNDLRTTDSETVGRDWTRNRMTPFSSIFRTILSVAVCSGSTRILFPGHSPCVPFVDMTMEAGNDYGARVVLLPVQGNAAREHVGTLLGFDQVPDVDVQVQEPCLLSIHRIFDDVWIADQSPVIVGPGGSD